MVFYNLKHNERNQTHIARGVKSLLWLILTDKQHIIQAEGFSPPQLDEKLNQKN